MMTVQDEEAWLPADHTRVMIVIEGETCVYGSIPSPPDWPEFPIYQATFPMSENADEPSREVIVRLELRSIDIEDEALLVLVARPEYKEHLREAKGWLDNPKYAFLPAPRACS